MGRCTRGQIADLLEGSEADSGAGSEASFEECSSHFRLHGMRCGENMGLVNDALARSPVWPLDPPHVMGKGT